MNGREFVSVGGRWVGMEVVGVQETQEALAELNPVFRGIIAKTFETAAFMIGAESYWRAPLGESGLLRASQFRNFRNDGLQAVVGFGAYYARFVEFGTKRAPAKPFLFPAFRIGARYVRQKVGGWAATAAEKVRFRTKKFYRGPKMVVARSRLGRR